MIAGLTWHYVAYSKGQWHELQASNKLTAKSIKLSRKALEISQRPWMLADEDTVKFKRCERKDCVGQIIIPFENFGKSPAVNVQAISSSHGDIRPIGRVSTSVLPQHHEAPTIAPGRPYNVMIPLLTFGGKKTYGTTEPFAIQTLVTYEDSFGNPYNTQTCLWVWLPRKVRAVSIYFCGGGQAVK